MHVVTRAKDVFGWFITDFRIKEDTKHSYTHDFEAVMEGSGWAVLWFTWRWKSFVLLLGRFLNDPEEVAVCL